MGIARKNFAICGVQLRQPARHRRTDTRPAATVIVIDWLHGVVYLSPCYRENYGPRTLTTFGVDAGITRCFIPGMQIVTVRVRR